MASGGGGGGGGGGGSSPVIPVLNPGAYLRQSGARTLHTNDFLTFRPDYLRINDDVIWDPALPTRLTFKNSGKYQIGGSMAWGPNSTDVRFVTILLNGGIQTDRMISDVLNPADAFNNQQQIVTRVRDFQAGDYVEFIIYQSCGTDLDTNTDADGYGDFWVQRVDQFTGDVGGCVERSTDQTIPSLTRTPIIFDGTQYDSGGFWDVGDPTKLVIPQDGRYLVGAAVDWTPNGTSIRYMEIRKNGAFIMGRDVNSRYPSFGLSSTQWFQRVDNLFAGDYLELVVLQYIGGGNLDCIALPGCNPNMWAQRLGAYTLGGP